MTEIRYATKDDLHIAFRVDGSGPVDIVTVPNWASDVEVLRDVPVIGAMQSRLESFARVTTFDQLGTGHSDPLFGEMPSLETYVDAIEVVMDAAGIGRAALTAWDLGFPAAVMYAATRPERVSAIATRGGSARWMADDDYPGLTDDGVDQAVEALLAIWGKPGYGSWLAPSMSSDSEACEAVARWTRSALSPGTFRRIFAMALRFDVRSLLPSVACPVLILCSSRWPGTNAEQVRYLADHLPSARVESFDTADHIPYQPDHFEWLLGEIQEFLTGVRPAPESDRMLATVLFTDIVGSTAKASEIGDSAWRKLLEQHALAVRRTVEHHKGHLIRVAGEESLATFDGPARAIRCARELHAATAKIGLDIRAGLHAGEIELLGEDIGGLAVHIGARVQAMAGPGEVLVSSTVKDLVIGSGINFEDRGTHTLKGVPDEWRIFAVRS